MAQNTNYNDLMNKISQLQQQAENVRNKERQTAIQSIQQQMKDYGLSVKDLGINTGRGRKAGSGKQSQNTNQGTNQGGKQTQGSNTAPKFRHPETGATWSGRGRMPKWINEAISQGRTKDEFAISK